MMIKNIDELSTCDWFPMPIHIKPKNSYVHPLQLHRQNTRIVLVTPSFSSLRHKAGEPRVLGQRKFQLESLFHPQRVVNKTGKEILLKIIVIKPWWQSYQYCIGHCSALSAETKYFELVYSFGINLIYITCVFVFLYINSSQANA